MLSKGRLISKKSFILFFLFAHVSLAILLSDLFALAPDEQGYLATFRNLYHSHSLIPPQNLSGWITAPDIFLWLVYAPAKILNLIGIPDVLSVRFLSILFNTLTLLLLLKAKESRKVNYLFSDRIVIGAFFIPSVFLWTTLGLRESFIMLELALILIGFDLLMRKVGKRGFILLILGSYSLLSTKSYLWLCLVLAVSITSLFYIIQKKYMLKMYKLLASAFLIPLALFVATSSSYALGFILNSDISIAGERSGDSVTQVTVKNDSREELITFHGDHTILALHSYVLNNPENINTQVIKFFGVDRRINEILEPKIKRALLSPNKSFGDGESLGSEHILRPGSMTEPGTLFLSLSNFVFGPIPFIAESGLTKKIASFESPLWWIFYSTVVLQIFRFREKSLIKEPQLFLASLFFIGFVLLSALVEVNVGTAFRHKSILIVPLAFLYFGLGQENAKERDQIE